MATLLQWDRNLAAAGHRFGTPRRRAACCRWSGRHLFRDRPLVW